MLNLLSGGNFRAADGDVLANGTLNFILSHDEQETSTPAQVVGGLPQVIQLDSTGNVVAGQSLEANDAMAPSGSYYQVMAYDSTGKRAWKCQQFVTITSSPSPFNLSAIVPTNPPGTGLSSEGGITLQTNGGNNSNQSLENLVAGSGKAHTNVSGAPTITATGGGGGGGGVLQTLENGVPDQ